MIMNIKKILVSAYILMSVSVFGQDDKKMESFINDFTKALDKTFSEKQLNKMFEDYSDIITPGDDLSQIKYLPKGKENIAYPLYNFKENKLYKDNIALLLNSKNDYQRILAYLVIGSSFDTSKENILLKKIVSEKIKGNLIWAGTSLLHLDTRHTDEIFDFLVKYEDFGDAHMLPLFIQLNKDSLLQTAYRRINKDDIKTRILAAQILSVTKLNAKTEEVLKQAIETWDIDTKGYAIYSVRELRIGNLLEAFKPLLNNQKTRAISLQALANSPTKTDRDYLFDIANQQDTLQSDILDCFYESKSIENIRFWLNLLYTKNIVRDYYFSGFKQPIIKSYSMLPDLQIALVKVKDKKILRELVRALENKTDDKTVEIIISLLKHPSPSVRYWTAKTVEENKSEKFKGTEISSLIKKGLEDGNTPDE